MGRCPLHHPGPGTSVWTGPSAGPPCSPSPRAPPARVCGVSLSCWSPAQGPTEHGPAPPPQWAPRSGTVDPGLPPWPLPWDLKNWDKEAAMVHRGPGQTWDPGQEPCPCHEGIPQAGGSRPSFQACGPRGPSSGGGTGVQAGRGLPGARGAAALPLHCGGSCTECRRDRGHRTTQGTHIHNMHKHVKHVYIRTHKGMHIRTCKYTTHACIYMCTHLYARGHTQTCTHTTSTQIQHTPTYTYPPTHTHTHLLSHTRTCG